jgi:hypothetical protein
MMKCSCLNPLELGLKVTDYGSRSNSHVILPANAEMETLAFVD